MRRDAIVWMLLVSVLCATIASGAEQTLVIDGMLDDRLLSGSYRAPIEFGRPVANLLEIRTSAGPRYVTYMTPPIYLEEETIEMNVSDDERALVRVIRFTTGFRGEYRNVTYTADRRIPADAILSNTSSESNATHTVFSFDLRGTYEITILQEYSRVEQRRAISTPDGPILLVSRPGGIIDANLTADARTVSITTDRATNVSITLPTIDGSFVPSAIREGERILGEPIASGATLELGTGRYEVPIRSEALLNETSSGLTFEVPAGTMNVSGQAPSRVWHTRFDEDVLVLEWNTSRASVRFDSRERIVSSGEARYSLPEGSFDIVDDELPDTREGPGIRLELSLERNATNCFESGSAQVCTSAPSEIGTARSTWTKHVRTSASERIPLERVDEVWLDGERIDCSTDTRCDPQARTLSVEAGTHEINYTLPSPIVLERRQGAGKTVVVTSPYPYENVTVQQRLPYEVNRAGAFALLWVRPTNAIGGEAIQQRAHHLIDTDRNGAYDTIRWIVPHLSAQEFRIVPIRSVEEYVGGSFVRDLTRALERVDATTATIEPSAELRVAFTETIGPGDDITFVGNLSGEATIEANGSVVAQAPITGSRTKIVLPASSPSTTTFTVSFSETVVLDQIIDPILKSYYDPTADVQTGWACTGADCGTGNYAVLDDGTRQPSAPDTTDFISQNANGGGTDEHSVDAITEANVSYITLWSYVSTGSNHEMTIALENGGTQVASTTVLPGTGNAWIATNWTVDATIGTMTAVYTSVKNGPAAPQPGFVYAWYLEVGYEDLLAPSIAFVAPTETEADILDRTYVMVNVTATDAVTGVSEIETNLYNRSSGTLVNTTNTSTSPHFTNFTNLADGLYAFNATATDNVSNANSTETRNVTIDTAFPTVQLEDPTPANASYLNVTSITVNATADDLTLTELRIDLFNATNGALVNTTNTSASQLNDTFGILAEDTYLLNATATDGLARTNTTPIRTITIDRTAPIISLVADTPANDTIRAIGNLPVNVSVIDANPDTSTISIYSGGSIVTTDTGVASRAETIALADGVYEYNATTTDLAGLTDSTQTRTITIDTTAPVLAVTNPVQDVTYIQSDVLISFSATDATTAVDSLWYFNGTDNVSYTAPVNVTLTNGNYTFVFYANDSAGNTASQSVDFEVDTNAPDSDAPTITIHSPLATTYNVSTIPVNFTAIDNVAVDTLTYYDGTTNNTYTTPVNRNLADADYTFVFYANDTASNIASKSRSFTIDTTPPILTYEEPTDNDSAVLARNYLLINVSAIETNLDTITVRLHNESGFMYENTSTSSPFLLNQSGLSDGTYTFNASVVDDAGFTDTLPNRTVTLDTGAPILGFEDPTPANDTKINTAFIDLNVSVIDPTLVNVTVYVYNATGDLEYSNTSNGSPFYDRVLGLSDETYLFNATAIDAAGLTNSTETRTVTIDTTIPSVQFVPPTEANNQRLNQTYVEVNITFSDNDLEYGKIEVLDQSGTVIGQSNSSTSPLFLNVTGLSDGIYFFRGIARDGAGNENVTATRTIELRTSPVQTTFTSYYDPINDVQNGWACSGSGCSNGDYDAVNDGVREPTIPTTSNFLSTSAGTGTSEQDVGSVTESGIATITLWAYVQTGSNFEMTIAMENDGTQVASTTVPTGTSASWVSVTWSTPAAVGTISGVYTSVKNGGGASTNGFVYSWYAAVDYDDVDPPVLTYVAPTDAAAGSYTRNYVLVNVTATDSLSGLDNVTTFLYTGADVFVSEDTKIFSPSFTNFTGLSSGAYKFNVTACDFADNCGNLPTRLVNIDGIAPNVSFTEPTDNHTALLNRSSIIANVTAADDFAGLDTITISIHNFTSGALVTSNTSNASPFYDEFIGLADGIYVLNATANDTFGNTNSTEQRRITIDTTPPNVTIDVPQNATYTDEDVDLNYTATDIRLDACSYSLDGAAFIELASCTNTTLTNLTTGSHHVRVRANDTAGNVALEQVFFTISAEKPDLLVEDIFFSGTVENEPVEVNVSVFNNASVASTATNVTLRIERIEASDVLVNETNATLPALGANARTNVTFTWIAQLGLYRFTAISDPANTVDEANETNNERSEQYAVSSYSIRYGTLNFSKFLSNAALDRYRGWSVTSPSGSIYFSDDDASWLPSNLAPLNGTSDLVEADTALDMTYHNDSINATWDADGNGAPDQTATFRISGSDVENVPIIPSTPGSPFITGILWDTADGGTEFDGSQDLVFATRLNASTAGTYGTYDYEVSVPVKLKLQIGAIDLVERTVEIE